MSNYLCRTLYLIHIVSGSISKTFTMITCNRISKSWELDVEGPHSGQRNLSTERRDNRHDRDCLRDLRISRAKPSPQHHVVTSHTCVASARYVSTIVRTRREYRLGPFPGQWHLSTNPRDYRTIGVICEACATRALSPHHKVMWWLHTVVWHPQRLLSQSWEPIGNCVIEEWVEPWRGLNPW